MKTILDWLGWTLAVRGPWLMSSAGNPLGRWCLSRAGNWAYGADGEPK